MNFTKENFIKFCKKIARPGVSIDLEILGGGSGFGYFEVKPYAKESAISYNIKKISNNGEEVTLYCSVRLCSFCIGESVVNEEVFLRYAKNVRLHGNFDNEILSIYKSL